MKHRCKQIKVFIGTMAVCAMMLAGFGTVQADNAWCPAPPDLDDRFIVIENVTAGDVVVDRTTNLIWERRPKSSVLESVAGWSTSMRRCFVSTTGDMGGWRVPTLADLQSLLVSGGLLPAGHPFQDLSPLPAGATNEAYWTSTDFVGNPAQKMVLLSIGISSSPAQTNASNLFGVWCVRGGEGVSWSSGN